jgi:hypothetical protein
MVGAASTVIEGEEEIEISVEVESDFSWVVQIAAPVDAVAVAPSPVLQLPPVVAP